jgi:prepilin-type processing-associated H-X9-DG protein
MQPPPVPQATAPSSYAACIGSNYAWGPPPDNGILVRHTTSPKGYRIADMKDGTSGTMVVGEMGFQLKDYTFTSGPSAGQVRGGNTSWPWGYASYSFGSTLVPINTKVHTHPSGLIGSGLHAFRSDHPAGCNFLFGDGAVKFLRDGIDHPTYQALSTRAGGEVVGDY